MSPRSWNERSSLQPPQGLHFSLPAQGVSPSAAPSFPSPISLCSRRSATQTPLAHSDDIPAVLSKIIASSHTACVHVCTCACMCVHVCTIFLHPIVFFLSHLGNISHSTPSPHPPERACRIHGTWAVTSFTALFRQQTLRPLAGTHLSLA